jgi:hypothetical protein
VTSQPILHACRIVRRRGGRANRVASPGVNEFPYDAKRRVQALILSTQTLIQRDPEQEVQGVAIQVVDAAITAVKAAKPDDPVVAATAELFSADHIATGQGVRAADILVVATQLDAAIGEPPPALA